jgi:small-conductance mechanosensitive channel
MQVEEIALLNTTLMRPDGGRFLYPNIVMSTLGVVNIARSGPHNEAFSVSSVLCFAVDSSMQPMPNPSRLWC